MSSFPPILPHRAWLGALSILLGCVGCANDTGRSDAPLVAVCTDPAVQLAPAAFECDDEVTIECGVDVTPAELFVRPPDGLTCADVTVRVDSPGPYPLGSTVVTAYGSDGADEVALCSATIEVIDTLPPVVEPHVVELWPPNHEMRELRVEDCVTVVDECDPSVALRFTEVTVDEPVNDVGDGNTAPDVTMVDCRTVMVRAERQGPEDGRVYTLGWEAIDDAGNVTTGTCSAEVPHDQSGAAAVPGAVQQVHTICP